MAKRQDFKEKVASKLPDGNPMKFNVTLEEQEMKDHEAAKKI